ncbi:MlaC/ttg2D family ABC transporter substrate-binding protein [Chondromyces apiculatus]|uniref:Toluene tolerance n=1 Tax=Chondromyces apiculatus DSM 436 TaxID=1192034 RepID=A0A017T902_9BACT|nr:ABC transporter substrate-binding protein [Chondromyces apiculatus]EYF05719.1 Toluene tolerance [Chondromyces apiculatus DSM 436]
MTRSKVKLFAVVLSLCTMTFAGAAFAGEATDLVKAKQTTLFQVMKQDKAANSPKVSALFDEMLDYKALAEASLGSEWAGRTDAERAEFSELLKQLVRRSYEKNLRKTLDFDIQYVGEKATGETVIVETKAVPKSKTGTSARRPTDDVIIAYKMVKKDGAWRVRDIVTDDVSLVSSYRSQFTKIVKKDGFPVLIKKMKDKIAKGES